MKIVWRSIGRCLDISVFIEEWMLTNYWRWIEGLEENCVRACDYDNVCFVTDIGNCICLQHDLVTKATTSERLNGRYGFVLIEIELALSFLQQERCVCTNLVPPYLGNI